MEPEPYLAMPDNVHRWACEAENHRLLLQKADPEVAEWLSLAVEYLRLLDLRLARIEEAFKDHARQTE